MQKRMFMWKWMTSVQLVKVQCFAEGITIFVPKRLIFTLGKNVHVQVKYGLTNVTGKDLKWMHNCCDKVLQQPIGTCYVTNEDDNGMIQTTSGIM